MDHARRGRVAYLVVPQLAVAVERRDRPRLLGQPLVIVSARSRAHGTQVLECSQEALQAGVRPNMPVRRAESLCPEAIFLPPRVDHYRQTAGAIFELLSGRMPAVEQAQPGGLYLDLSGLEGQDREALALCRQLAEGLFRELCLAATAGVAVNKFSAEAASLSIGLNRVLVLTAGTERSFLGDFPVNLLPVEEAMRWRLALFGLRRLAQFARLPPAAVLVQFGWDGQRAHRLARGEDDRPVVPGRPERHETAGREFDPPLDNLETLIAVAGQLATELSSRLAPAFLRADQLALAVNCADGNQLATQRTLAQPTADGERLGRLAETLLRALRYPDRVSDLAMTLSGLSAPSVHQLSLWHTPQQVAAEAHLDRLASRYGPACFRRGLLVDPEHRLAARRFVVTAWQEDK